MSKNETELEIFKNDEFGEVRTMIINNEPWFNAKDISDILGYAQTSNMMKRIDNEDFMSSKMDGMNMKSNLINESGLYSAIIGSKNPSAKKFKRWITSEVLPSIRKHGAYMTEQTIEKALTSPDFLIQLATQLKEEQNARRLAEQKIEEQKPLVEFATKVSDSSNLIDMGKMAKLLKDEDINIGRNRLFDWLRNNGILMSNNVPYQRYIDGGYFEVKESVYETPYGTKTQITTKVTGKGQIYITEKLRKEWKVV